MVLSVSLSIMTPHRLTLALLVLLAGWSQQLLAQPAPAGPRALRLGLSGIVKVDAAHATARLTEGNASVECGLERVGQAWRVVSWRTTGAG